MSEAEAIALQQELFNQAKAGSATPAIPDAAALAAYQAAQHNTQWSTQSNLAVSNSFTDGFAFGTEYVMQRRHDCVPWNLCVVKLVEDVMLHCEHVHSRCSGVEHKMQQV